MFLNRILIFCSVISLVIVLTAGNNTPKEDESKDNSIGLMARSARKYVQTLLPAEWDKSSLVTNIAMPALFLLFLSSVTNVNIENNFKIKYFLKFENFFHWMSAKERATELNSIKRRKRSSPIACWADNLQHILTNFQKAIAKMQKFEEELENEISDDSVETIDMAFE